MPDPMTDDERALLEHRWAVRVNLPGQARHAAQVARRLVDAAADAHLDAPAVVVRAVAALEGYAVAVHQRVTVERAELERRGVDTVTFQQDLERGALTPPLIAVQRGLRSLPAGPGRNQVGANPVGRARPCFSDRLGTGRVWRVAR